MYRDVIESGLLDEESTDWLWAANQSMDRAFVKYLDEQRFLNRLSEIAELVKNHNTNHQASWTDARLKS